MGQLVFQATAGGQVALVGPNPSTSFSLNVPAVNGTLVTTGDTATVTNTMISGPINATNGGTGVAGTLTGILYGNGTSAHTVATTAQALSLIGTVPVANGGTGSTTSTGSGSVVLQTSPSITTPTIDKINTSVGNTSLGAGNASIMKNRIINGAMVIDQRNAGASVTPTSGQYTLDRWQGYLTQASKYTIQQNAGSVTTPVGFKNYLGVTSSSAYSIGSTDYFFLQQGIEGYNIADLGWGTANAKTVTLSFQVYSSLTGTFGGSIRNSAGDRSYPFTYTISSANTWTTATVTIVGDTSGTWESTNGTGLRVDLGLGVGSTYSGTAGSWASANYFSATGATSVVGTSGATFYITGVQLEVGSSATGYEYRQYGQELALCQRYFETYQAGYLTGSNYSTSSSQGFQMYFKVTKRATPTMAIVSGTATVSNAVAGNAGGTVAINTQPNSVSNGGDLYVSGATGLVAGNAGLLIPANLIISYSAEL